MKNKYSKKQIEELYNCKIQKEDGYYSAIENEEKLFSCAIGDTLDELHEQIRERIKDFFE